MATYHHKGISRIEAEQLLLAAGRDGSFLVRDSETVQGAYTLCLLSGGVSKQYRILPGKNGLFVQAEEGVVNKSFENLKQLIDSYIQRGDHNGLLCALKYPIPLESPDTDDDEETEELPPAVAPQISDSKTSTLTFLKFFKERSQQLDLSSVPGPFANALKQYSEDEILIDRDSIINGAEKPKKLQEVIAMACEDLDKELTTFMTKIELCKELFGPINSQPQLHKSASTKRKEEGAFNAFYKKLTMCKTAVESLEKKAVNTLKSKLPVVDSGLDSTDGATVSVPSTPPVPPHIGNIKAGTRPKIPKKEYDVHLYKHGKAGTKLKVSVDVEQGKLFAVKEKGSQLDETNVFSSDQIQQLIKSSKDKCRLEVKIVDRKNQEFQFVDARERESFCQHIKQMKMLHSQYTEVTLIRVFVGTWNMAENQIPPNLNPWLKCQGQGKCMELQEIPHDVYVIGTQETVSSDLIKQIKLLLSCNYGVDFHVVASETLWQIRIIVLVKPEYKDKISHVQTANVPTGIANKLGNKGGVAVSFTFNGTGFCFICGHLAARHDEKRNLKRHQNYRDIVKGLHLGPKFLNQVCDITQRFHHVFFFGDLNYRLIELEPELIISQVKCQKYEKLLEYDQLKSAQKSKLAFQGFKEDEILFPPSYRYQKGSRDQYAWEKVKKSGIRINAPSWCDRVLWKSYPDTHIESLAYGSVQDVVSSDHKPVFSSFEVGLESQALPPKENSAGSGDTVIVFTELEAKVISHGKEAFKLEFHSSCLEKVVLSQKNSSSADPTPGYNAPKWRKQDIPKLTPLFGNVEYLEGQHLIVAVKTDDNMESYGECVIALKSRISEMPVSFDSELIHQGESTGRLWGKMHIRCQSYKREPRAVRAYGAINPEGKENIISPQTEKSQHQKAFVQPEEKVLRRIGFMKQLVYMEDGIAEEGKADKAESYSDPVSAPNRAVLRKEVRSEAPDPTYTEPSNPPGRPVARKSMYNATAEARPTYSEVNLESKRLSRLLKDDSKVEITKLRDPASKSDAPIPKADALPPKSNAVSPKSGASPQNSEALPLPPKSGALSKPAAALPPKPGLQSVSPASPKSGVMPPPCHVTKPVLTKASKPEEHEDKGDLKPTLPPRRAKEEPGIPTKKSPKVPDAGNALPPKPADRKKHTNIDETNNNRKEGVRNDATESSTPIISVKPKETSCASDSKVQWPKSVIGELNPLYGDADTSGLDTVDYGRLDREDSVEAPTLPPRRKYHEAKVYFQKDQTYYDRLYTPASVDDWLKGLQLKEYTDVFKKSGWDRIDYLDDMNRDDLKHMGINDSLLQQRILNSIADMKKQ